MRINEILSEAKESIRDQIIAAVKRDGGSVDDYYIRFTDIDKLGYSAKQSFGKTPDVDDPKFSVDSIGAIHGRRALWFYPVKYFLNSKELFRTEFPYVFIVKLKPNAWLQTVKRGDKKVIDAPEGKERVGILRMSSPPAAIFFRPGYQLVSKLVNYKALHQDHGLVKGPEAAPKPTALQRIRDKFGEAQEPQGLGLTIFDIDDTLFHTTAQIKVIKHGQVIRSLTNQEFNHYELGPGEQFDFGEFRDAEKFNRESKPIRSMIAKLKAILNRAGNSRVIMLTARADFDDKHKFLDTFKRYGIDMSRIHVHRAGNLPGDELPAEKKAIWVRRYLDTGKYGRVRLYDDSKTNLRVFKELKQEYPHVDFQAFYVGPEGQATVHENKSLQELGTTQYKITEPKDMVNYDKNKQVTYKVFKFKVDKQVFLIVFTVKDGTVPGNKKKVPTLNVAFGRQDHEGWSDDDIDTNLTGDNQNQFQIYSTVVKAIHKFINQLNPNVGQIIIKGDNERQQVMYDRFFNSRYFEKYFPGWHINPTTKSLVRSQGSDLQEIEAIPAQSFAGGKDILHTNRLPAKRNLKPLPGGTDLLYAVERNRYVQRVSIVEPGMPGITKPHVVAVLNLDTVTYLPNTVQVQTITVDEHYRGRGLAKALYGLVFTVMRKNLLSGASQTPGGRRNWMSLANIPGVEVRGMVRIPDQIFDMKRHSDRTMDQIMALGGQFFTKNNHNTYWLFDVVPGKGSLQPAVKNSLSKLYDKDSDTLLLATWSGNQQGVTEESSQPSFNIFSRDDFETSFEVELTVDGKDVGFFAYQYFPETNDVENDSMIYTNDFRGQGYGKMLLVKAIETAQQHDLPFKIDRNGITPAQLNVYKSLLNNRVIRMSPDKTITLTSKHGVAEGVMSDLDQDQQDANWDAIVGYVIDGLKKNQDVGRMELNLYMWGGKNLVDVDQELEDRGFGDLADLADHIQQHGGQYQPPTNFGLDSLGRGVAENFADGKVKGKSRPGRVKSAGASCDGSVTDLRAKAKKYGGERGKMYHWCANMKSGRDK
jgi:GNAT superfamily N-acetyltransferase